MKSITAILKYSRIDPVTQTPPELVNWINDQMNARGWSQNELARQADISSGAISRVMNGYRPGVDICTSLARAFGVPAETVLTLAGHIKKKPEGSPLMDELVALFRQLSEEDQEAEVAALRVRVERFKHGKPTRRS